MPLGCFHLDGEEFERAYLALLDDHGPDRIRERLDALTEPSALTCFEPQPPCHRFLAARWIREHLGIEITELRAPGVQLRLEEAER